MGSLTAGLVQQIRSGISLREFRQVEQLLLEAIHSYPGEPDLLTELGILRTYQGREGEAFDLLPLAARGERGRMLLQILANHLACRELLNEKDFDAHKRLDILKPFRVEPEQVAIDISACIIVRNEQEHLGRCLASLQGLVHEIVVVDTGSTDDTVDIAKEFGAIVGTFEWCDDFSAARNAAIGLASGKWILSIDADEQLTAESKTALDRAVVRPHVGGFDIEIVNYTDDRTGGDEFRHCPTRLFQNRPDFRFEGRIHEQISPSIARLGLPWARLEGARILHHGYRPQEMAKKAKMERTIGMLRREVQEHPIDPFHWFNLTNAYVVGGRLAEAEAASFELLKLLDAKTPYAAHSYAISIQAAYGCGHIDRAIKLGLEAGQRRLETISVAFELCQSYLLANRIGDALRLSDRLMGMKWEEGATGDRGIYTHKRLILRGQILALVARLPEALECLNGALEVDGTLGAAIYSRGAVLEKLGRFEDALQDYSDAAKADRYTTLALKGSGRALVAMGRHGEAVEAFQAAWRRCQTDKEAWVGWMKACESVGDTVGAAAAYEAFASTQEPSANVFINWGRALEAAGNPDKALRCFAEAIKLEPSCANAYFNCGDLLYRVGATAQAVHLYEAGLVIAPDNADGWFTLGNALAKAGNDVRALEAYRVALEHNPRHTAARHNMAVLSEEEPKAA